MASRKERILGVGSLFSFNRVLLFKWRWRLFYSMYALWVRVVKVIYGEDGCYSSLLHSRFPQDPWSDILRSTQQSKFLHISLIRLLLGDLTWSYFIRDL